MAHKGVAVARQMERCPFMGRVMRASHRDIPADVYCLRVFRQVEERGDVFVIRAPGEAEDRFGQC